MSEPLGPYDVYREAKYICQNCETRFQVSGHTETAENCPICGENPGAPEVIGQ